MELHYIWWTGKKKNIFVSKWNNKIKFVFSTLQKSYFREKFLVNDKKRNNFSFLKRFMEVETAKENFNYSKRDLEWETLYLCNWKIVWFSFLSRFCCTYLGRKVKLHKIAWREIEFSQNCMNLHKYWNKLYKIDIKVLFHADNFTTGALLAQIWAPK